MNTLSNSDLFKNVSVVKYAKKKFSCVFCVLKVITSSNLFKSFPKLNKFLIISLNFTGYAFRNALMWEKICKREFRGTQKLVISRCLVSDVVALTNRWNVHFSTKFEKRRQAK